MSRSASALTADEALIANYLQRVGKAARHLPPARREHVTPEIAARVFEAVDADKADLATVLAGLGNPRDFVRAVDGHVPGTGTGWMEPAAALLVLVGGLIRGGVGWAAGLALLWASPRWRWPDKLLATMVWPGGLLAVWLLTERYTTQALAAAGGLTGPRSSARFVLDMTLGHPAWRHLLVLAAAAAPPVLVAIRLIRSARQPGRAASTTEPAVSLDPETPSSHPT
jgi:hypothetical protein